MATKTAVQALTQRVHRKPKNVAPAIPVKVSANTEQQLGRGAQGTIWSGAVRNYIVRLYHY